MLKTEKFKLKVVAVELPHVKNRKIQTESNCQDAPNIGGIFVIWILIMKLKS